VANGVRSFVVTNAAQNGNYLLLTVTKTNGSIVTVGVTNTPATNTTTFLQSFFAAVNTHPDLMADDGVKIEDFVDYSIYLFPPISGGEFNIVARNPAWPASQIQVRLTGSANFDIAPADIVKLDDNAKDLQPRSHLYVTAGVSNLNVDFVFNSTTFADGYHDLTAVAYEGSHVRTQKRVTQSIRIQNTPLSAEFVCLPCDTNTALEATMMFSVLANTNNITKIELFSTGGSWESVSNQSSAAFSVPASNLGVGLHPFYAIVTRNDGKQYRTETKWIRILAGEAPFRLSIAGTAPMLSWPATAGRQYEVLSATNPASAFELRESLIPTNSAGQWVETNNTPPKQFYRVRTSQ